MPDTRAAPLDLTVLRCRACGALDPGPRELCATCQSGALETVRARGTGTLVSWTVIRRPPLRLQEEEPYAVAVVKLDEGVVVTGRLHPAEAESRSCGERVACTGFFRESVPVFEACHG